VGPGPTNQTAFNIPTTTVKICLHGTTTCATVPNVLVDTGSPGLRLIASALGSFSTPFQQDQSTPGNFIVECLPFADGFTWGPVANVDVVIGGETASSVPVNIIDDTGNLEPTAPTNCSNGAQNLSSVSQLGANGVLGIGLFTVDCGSYCALPVVQQTMGSLYYSCSTAPNSCNPVSEDMSLQVINPVAMFPTDNNGVILQLPAIPSTGQVSDTGYLVFGIGTESNNGLEGATVLTTDGSGFITTMYNGQTLPYGFLDSGSNGYFFPDSSIAVCTGFTNASEFYCPTTTPLSLSATNQGHNGTTTPVPFTIENLNDLNNTFFAANVGGPSTGINLGNGITTNDIFDFGVPFFYGRTVFTAIAGAPAGSATGPYFAY
jgi:hypothetical protein